MDLTTLTTSEIRACLSEREVSAEEIVHAHLARIEEKDKEVRAYLHLSPERALEQARRIDQRVAAGEPLPPLAGVPVAVKDVILTRGTRTTCASRILENYLAPYDASSRITAVAS